MLVKIQRLPRKVALRRPASALASSLSAMLVCTTTNSSPPSRAITSSGRVTARKRSAMVFGQQKVSTIVSQSVIHFFETIKIDGVQGQATCSGRQRSYCAFESFNQVCTIRESVSASLNQESDVAVRALLLDAPAERSGCKEC